MHFNRLIFAHAVDVYTHILAFKIFIMNTYSQRTKFKFTTRFKLNLVNVFLAHFDEIIWINHSKLFHMIATQTLEIIIVRLYILARIVFSRWNVRLFDVITKFVLDKHLCWPLKRNVMYIWTVFWFKILFQVTVAIK